MPWVSKKEWEDLKVRVRELEERGKISYYPYEGCHWSHKKDVEIKKVVELIMEKLGIKLRREEAIEERVYLEEEKESKDD